MSRNSKEKAAEVAARGDGSDLPEYLRKLEGLDDKFKIESDDVVPPSIKLVTAQSSVRKDYPKLAKEGQFFHTGEEISMGEEFDFMPLQVTKSIALINPDFSDDNPILAMSRDTKKWDRWGSWEVRPDKNRTDYSCYWTIPESLSVAESGLLEFGTSIPDNPTSPPAASLSKTFLVYPIGGIDYGPSMFRITRTSLKHAKRKLTTQIYRRCMKGAPSYSQIYRASINVESGKVGTYSVWDFEFVRFAEEAEFEHAREMAQAVYNMEVRDSDVDKTEDIPW